MKYYNISMNALMVAIDNWVPLDFCTEEVPRAATSKNCHACGDEILHFKNHVDMNMTVQKLELFCKHFDKKQLQEEVDKGEQYRTLFHEIQPTTITIADMLDGYAESCKQFFILPRFNVDDIKRQFPAVLLNAPIDVKHLNATGQCRVIDPAVSPCVVNPSDSIKHRIMYGIIKAHYSKTDDFFVFDFASKKEKVNLEEMPLLNPGKITKTFVKQEKTGNTIETRHAYYDFANDIAVTDFMVILDAKQIFTRTDHVDIEMQDEEEDAGKKYLQKRMKLRR